MEILKQIKIRILGNKKTSAAAIATIISGCAALFGFDIDAEKVSVSVMGALAIIGLLAKD